jgi:hypothetical protein
MTALLKHFVKERTAGSLKCSRLGIGCVVSVSLAAARGATRDRAGSSQPAQCEQRDH